MDYAKLGQEVALAQYQGLDVQAVAVALNEKTIPKVVDLATEDVRGVLLATGEWGALCIAAERPATTEQEYQVKGAAITARDTLVYTRTMETSQPAKMAAIQQLLGLLNMVGVISAETMDNLLAMPQTTCSRAEVLGLEVVTDQDVLTVRRMAQMEQEAADGE